jgi:hypothetical protein
MDNNEGEGIVNAQRDNEINEEAHCLSLSLFSLALCEKSPHQASNSACFSTDNNEEEEIVNAQRGKEVDEEVHCLSLSLFSFALCEKNRIDPPMRLVLGGYGAPPSPCVDLTL